MPMVAMSPFSRTHSCDFAYFKSEGTLELIKFVGEDLPRRGGLSKEFSPGRGVVNQPPMNRAGDRAAEQTHHICPARWHLHSPATYVSTVVLQPDGRILVGGDFSNLSGQPRSGFGRLNPDGSLDASFNPTNYGQTKVIALQANGKIVTAHWSHPEIKRFQTSGRLDTNFIFFADDVEVITVQPDGNILLGGSFTTVNGTNRNRLARILPGDTDLPPPTPPQMRNFSKRPGGIFRFDVADPGDLVRPLDLLAATNLTQLWTHWALLPLRPGTNGNHLEFTDQFPLTNNAPRFYRLRVDPP